MKGKNMNDNEIIQFNNMIKVYGNLKRENEDYYFNIYKIVECYQDLKNYFKNSKQIDKILNKKYDNNTLLSLLKNARHRHGHAKKIDGLKEYIILRSKVDKKEIDLLIYELTKEINDIFNELKENQPDKLILKTENMMTLSLLMKEKINSKEIFDTFDERCRKDIQKIFNDFKYDNDTLDEWEKRRQDLISFFRTDECKNTFCSTYDKNIYDDLIKLLDDDNISEADANKIMAQMVQVSEKIKKEKENK